MTVLLRLSNGQYCLWSSIVSLSVRFDWLYAFPLWWPFQLTVTGRCGQPGRLALKSAMVESNYGIVSAITQLRYMVVKNARETTLNQNLATLLAVQVRPGLLWIHVHFVVRFCPWCKFYFPLFWGIIMYGNESDTKENKIKTKDKIELQRTHQGRLPSCWFVLMCWNSSCTGVYLHHFSVA